MTDQNKIEALIDAAVKAKLEARGLTDDQEGDWYNLNGLRVAQNPEEYLVRNPVGQTEHDLPQYAEAPSHLVPNTDVSYVATERPGHVRSDEDVAVPTFSSSQQYIGQTEHTLGRLVLVHHYHPHSTRTG